VNESLVAAAACAIPGVVAAIALGSPWGWLVLAPTAAVAAYAVRRAFRLAIEVSSEHVVVRNYWRVYEFDWLDVTQVGLGEMAMGPTTGPAVAFILRDGRVIRAQATPSSEEQPDEFFSSLAALAPPSVGFLHPTRAND
jgi:hypothetical protein